MENRHITQALQEILADLPDQEERFLLFTAKIDALEKREGDAGSDVAEGWEDIAGGEAGRDSGGESGRQKAGGKKRPAGLDTRGFRSAAFAAVTVLAVIEAILIIILLVSGGGRADEPSEPSHPDSVTAEPDSSYAEPSEEAKETLDVFAPQDPNTDPVNESSEPVKGSLGELGPNAEVSPEPTHGFGTDNSLDSQGNREPQMTPGTQDNLGAQDDLGAQDNLGAQDDLGTQDNLGAQDDLGTQDNLETQTYPADNAGFQ